MKKIIFAPLLFLLYNVSFSQNNKIIDSLELCLKSSKNDTNKIKILDDLSWNYSTRDTKKAIDLANQQLELSRKLNFKKGEANALINIGSVYYLQSNCPLAIQNFNEALTLRKKLHDKVGAAGLINNIAMIYKLQGNYPKAINYFLQSLKIFEELKDDAKIASSFNNLGVTYQDIKKFDLALYYLLKCKNMREKMKDKGVLSGVYVNIGNTYFLQKKYLIAIDYFNRALTLQNDVQDKFTIARLYNSMGAIYKEQGNYKLAIEYLNKAYTLKEFLSDKDGLVTVYYSIGDANLNLGNLDLAVEYYKKAQSMAQSINNKEGLKWAYKGLITALTRKKNFEEAVKYSMLYEQVKDSLLNEISYKQIAEMQTKYDTEKKEQQIQIKSLEIEKQKQKNKIQIILFIGIAFVIIIIAFLIFYRNKLKQKAAKILEQNKQDKLRFKAMIDSEENERIRIAKELHDGLGQLLSSAKLNISSLEGAVSKEDEYLLENSSNIIDEAVKEVRTISHNMMPTALMNYGLGEAVSELTRRINDSKQIVVNFEKEHFLGKLEKETEISLYRIIQEIVNNMIKHSQAKNIDIRIANIQNKIELSIKDNGSGFDTSAIKESKGIGWHNIYSRVSMLNGKISINSQAGKGTEINIEI